MSSIDNRVVEMEFDNKAFQQGVQETLDSLEALKEGLKLEGATKGLSELESASQNVNLDGIASGVDHIANRFSAMGAVGFTVIQNLTTAAMDFATRIGRMALDPLIQGGRKRAENIEQAKFQFRGLGMDIEATMESALGAVTGTAFGLDEAARAAGQFGASGMTAGEDMTTALRAISGVAAMTNSTYTDTADIFTKVAGNGRVMGDDLLRMSSRGLNAAATLAKAMNVTEAEVRQMVTEGKVDFETFYRAMDEAFGENATKANETYAGSLANLRAAFSRIGASFFTPWLEQQRDLFNALSPAIDEVGKVLGPVIGLMTDIGGRSTKGLIDFINGIDFSQMNQMITPLVAIIENVLTAIGSLLGPIRDAFGQIFPPTSVMAIAGILTSIEKFTYGLKMGGDTAENFRRTMAGVFAVIGIGWEVVKSLAVFLFDLFGVVTEGSGGFLEATGSIGDFLVALHQAVKNGEGLTKFFEGLVDVLRAPIQIIKNLAGAITGLFDFDPPSTEGWNASFEPLTALGEMILSVWDNVLEKLAYVWGRVKVWGQNIAKVFSPIGDLINDVFGGASFEDAIKVFETTLLGGIFLMIRRFADNLSNSFGSIQYNLTEPFKKITFTLNTMQNTLRAMTLMQIAIAIALLAGSVVALSKVDGPGLTRALTAMTVMFTQLMVALKGFTMIGGTGGLVGVGAGLILLAIAIRILASAVKALADLSWEELAKGLTGVTVLIGALTLAVRGMSGQTANMISAGAGLLIIAFAIKVLVSAVTDLSGLSWEEMAKGLVGVGSLLASLAIFTRLSALNKGGFAQGAGLLLLAFGIRILADAVNEFAALSWEEIGKGMASIGGILAGFALFSKAIGNPAKLVSTGASLVLIGIAMNILARAMGEFGKLSWEEIGKGLVSMAGALVAIVLALNLMPPSTLASAAALVVVSFALGLIADAMGQMGGMSWGEIGKGLVTLAGALAIIAVAMFAMTTALPGAAATLVVAAALAILAPVLKTLGGMSIREIVTGLATLAGVFIILGVAALVLTPMVPTLMGLGIAIGLIGIAVLAAGLGVLAFATGLTALAAAGAAGTAAIVAMGAGLIGLIPMLGEALGQALVVFAEVIATAGPQILDAMTTILQSIIGAIQENAPGIINLLGDMLLMLVEKITEIIPPMAEAALQMILAVWESIAENVPLIVRTMIDLVVGILEALADGVPEMARAGTDLIVAFLESIAENLGDVITAAADIVIALVEGISENSVRIVEAGFEAIISFIDGIANAIDENAGELRAAGGRLARAIANGLTGGLGEKVGEVAGKARELANNAVGAIKGVFRVSSPSKVMIDIGRNVGDGLVMGMDDMQTAVGKSAEGVGTRAVSAMQKSLSDISKLIDTDIDMDPTITPVLDLTPFQRTAALIDTTLMGKQLAVDMAYSKARDASTKYQANEADRAVIADTEGMTPQQVINYVQNNTSPKALSSAEIYRQTKNQLSITRGALSPNAVV